MNNFYLSFTINKTMVKYYAVRKGREIGIFTSWKQVEPLVKGYPNAQHKSFPDIDSAQSYLMIDGTNTPSPSSSPIISQLLSPHNSPSKISTPISSSLRRSPLVLRRSVDKQEFYSPFDEQYDVVVYTDGSADLKSGGYGVVITSNDEVVTTFKGSLDLNDYSKPTNNQSELYAIKVAIDSTENYQKILIKTDSSYSINSLTKWCYSWIANGWKTSQGGDVLNRDLIEDILKKLRTTTRIIEFEHVPGHAGIKYNEMADKLANEGRLSSVAL